MNTKTVGVAVVALVVGFGAGYITHTTPPATNPQGSRGSFGGAGNMRGGSNGSGLLSGTVATKDAGSITVNTRDGSSHVVLITPATIVSKSVTGATSDVLIGTTVIVSGTANTDGSVAATLIQLRPTPPTVTPTPN